MRCVEEDGDGGDDEVRGEDPEAEAVDDHGCKLPLVDLVLRVVAFLHAVRDEAQLAEDRQQLALHRRLEAVVEVVEELRGVSRSAVVVDGARVLRAVLAVDGDHVVDVLDIREQTHGGRVARLQLAHLRLAQKELARQRAPRSLHAQNPRQPLADQRAHLSESSVTSWR